MSIEEWLRALGTELGVDDLDLGHADVRRLLDVARDAAHAVERPAAPLSTFLLGVAVGRGADLTEASETTSELARRLGHSPAEGSAD